MRHADLVICNTDHLKHAMQRISQSLAHKRFVVFPNGFDDDIESLLEKDLPQSRSRQRLILHLGDIYMGRRIDTFCRAIAILINRGLLSLDSIKVQFVGMMDPVAREAGIRAAAGLVEKGCIEFRLRVPAKVAVTYYSKADVLLVVSGDSLRVPAKFIEYLSTGIPIFAISPPGALQDMMERDGMGAWANVDSVEDICEKLLHVLKEPRTSAHEARRKWERRYHYKALAASLANWVHEETNATSDSR